MTDAPSVFLADSASCAIVLPVNSDEQCLPEPRMTALKQYQRLESPGVWRASPEHQRKDVIVSVGDATLIMYDKADRPLTHWSLPALVRLNGSAKPAIFSPGTDSTEELEISEDWMIEAIERVQEAIRQRNPKKVWPRLLLFAGSLLLLCALWLPELLVKHAAAVVPDAKRAELGERLLNHIQRTSGRPCHTAAGTAALSRLHKRLLNDRPGRLVVLPNGIAQTSHLPGGLILLHSALVEDYEPPDVVAGYVIAETMRADIHDPVARLLEQAGLMAALRLLVTGDLNENVLISQARALLSQPVDQLDREALLERFREARISTTPYAVALGDSDDGALQLIEADPGSDSPVLSDADWVSLQGICRG